MADLSSEQRQQNETRQHRKRERGVARHIAQGHAAGAMDRLISEGGPDWFTPEQAHAYKDELQRLRLRISASGFDRDIAQNTCGLARGRA